MFLSEYIEILFASLKKCEKEARGPENGDTVLEKVGQKFRKDFLDINEDLIFIGVLYFIRVKLPCYRINIYKL